MLNGVKILDLTRYFPGPFATLRLLERGAQVIKIEDKNGDPARYMDSLNGEEGVIFRSMSRGKKSVSLNLKEEADRERFYELVKSADALIESFRPGVTARLGIDYGTLSAINPTLTYVSVSGYGQNTSIAHLAGHDLNYMSLSGVLDQLLDKDGAPIKPQMAIADLITGFAASEAVLTGLVNSARSGKGSYIDLSMTDAMLSCMGLHVCHQSAGGGEHGINDHGIGYGIFKTSDGRYISLCALEEKFFANFCKAVNMEHLIPQQHGAPDIQNPYYREIVELFSRHSFDEWCDFAKRVDCCMSPVLHVSELKDSEYVRERKLIEHKWGLDYMSTVYTGSDDFLCFEKPFPKLGEDNETVLNKD